MPHSAKHSDLKQASKPVPPDAVRVWRGFRLPTLAPPDFLQALGTVFIPATAQLQRLYGLTAYLPTVLPVSKPAGVPDEIAIVFYESQQAYKDTSLVVAGRAYSMLHKAVFAFPASQSGFPVLLDSALSLDTPYHLFNDAVDWQGGYSQVFVGARNASVPAQKFAADLQTFFQDLQKQRPEGLDGVIGCVSANWVTYWEHWNSESASFGGRISELPRLADRLLLQPSTPTPVDGSLTAHNSGLADVESKSYNIVFSRA